MRRLLSISLLPLAGFALGVIYMAQVATGFANMDSSEIELPVDEWQIRAGIALIVVLLLELVRRIALGGLK